MTERPNLLFFFPDQLRPDWLGLNLAEEQPEQVERLKEQLRAELGNSEDHRQWSQLSPQRMKK